MYENKAKKVTQISFYLLIIYNFYWQCSGIFIISDHSQFFLQCVAWDQFVICDHSPIFVQYSLIYITFLIILNFFTVCSWGSIYHLWSYSQYLILNFHDSAPHTHTHNAPPVKSKLITYILPFIPLLKYIIIFHFQTFIYISNIFGVFHHMLLTNAFIIK